MKTLKTTLHHYCFDTTDPVQAAAYNTLHATLVSKGYAPRWHHVLSTARDGRPLCNDSEEVELETQFLFSNQWNEADHDDGIGRVSGRRLFDWYEGIYPNKSLRAGHWLEITPEMDAIRKHTTVCGYCGAHHHEGEEFCDKCLGSEHLKESELHLLRLLPVAEHNPKRALLTAEETVLLVPLYREAQGLGKMSREQAAKTKARQKVAALIPQAYAKCEGLIEVARAETEIHTRLLDAGLNLLGNTIWYSHTKRWCFGWYKPLDKATADSVRAALEGLLPDGREFNYDIKEG